MTGIARADDASATSESAKTVSEVTVTGKRVRSLEQFTPTGSRLNLSARDTPATLDVIGIDTITTRGYLSVEEAADSMPGVTSGGAPGDLENFHIRGFSDTQITVLHNGLYIGPSDMVNRPQNTFNVESVEILKGPASVLYGQGAIGAAVNVVNKAVSFGPPTMDAYGAVGSFGATAIGVGGSTQITDDLAVRADFSRTSTDGYIHHTPGDSLDATLSLLWKPTPKLDVQFSIDVLQDHPSPYWGTPLVPTSFATDPLKGVASSTTGGPCGVTGDTCTIDARMRSVNYNVADYKIRSQQYWPQLFIKWRPTDNIDIENFFYYFHANRRWIDSESYAFVPAAAATATTLATPASISRDRFFVFHQQDLVGDQASASFNNDVFGLQNKLVVGFDYSHLDFDRQRGFPNGDNVDPFNPSPGLFGALADPGTVIRDSPTHWDDPAVFFEDVLNITDKIKVVTGSRYDVLSLNRENFGPTGAFQASSSFKQTYRPFTFRVGLVYDINKYLTPYVSVTTGQDPVGSNIFLVNANQNFQLGRSTQVEGGIKASAPDNRASLTFAVYDIVRKNLLTTLTNDTVVPVGQQTSKGFETSGDVRLTDQWTVNANLAYTDAKYDHFSPDGVISYSGNEVPNAPKWLANVWTSYTHVLGLPLELGGGIRYVGDRAGNDANTLKLDAYTTLNIYATYSITPHIDLSFRVDNLTDKAYAQAADINYPAEIILGRPRYFQFDVKAHF